MARITVENRLKEGRRDLNVFHHGSRGSHLIGHDSSVSFRLRSSGEGDYLHISVVRGPGFLWRESVISLPWWADFDFAAEGKIGVNHSLETGRVLVKIPPGPPTWELTVTRSANPGAAPGETEKANHTANHIIVRDD